MRLLIPRETIDQVDPPVRPASRAWRCNRCNAVLGILRDGRRLYIRNNGLEIEASLPVTRRCRCGEPNVLEP